MSRPDPALARAYDHAAGYRSRRRELHAREGAEALRRRFCLPLPETGRDGPGVIEELIAAAEPGLVGNTAPDFFAWVMGGSDTTGVAADWLTSIWGQNSAIFQTSPAAAIAEEAVAAWLLELLDLPRQSSVGLVTGATMAGFVGLAAARSEVLARAGYDLERDGLQGAPLVRVFIGADSHESNFAALRYLGFGERNLVRVETDSQGVMRADALAAALAASDGPAIVIATAGHINTGGFADFEALAAISARNNAWLHVDGAFGLWARLLPEKAALTRGIEKADSWSVDGHKWLQIPYDSGFAVVRHTDAHRRAMAISASYLTRTAADGRNPTEYNPELSRRARGFAAWAVIRSLGRQGVAEMVRRHCEGAARLAGALATVPGVEILNRVDLNQIVLRYAPGEVDCTEELARRLNEGAGAFVRTTTWAGAPALRISVISKDTGVSAAERLAARIAGICAELCAPGYAE